MRQHPQGDARQCALTNLGGHVLSQRLFWRIAGTSIAIGVSAGLILALAGWPVKMLWYRGMIVGGFVSVAIALMGFWAYLFLNFFVRTFLPLRVWIWFQGLVILLTLIDVVYFFPSLIAQLPTGLSLPPGNYLVFILVPPALSAVVAYLKARATARDAFVPTLFFMYVFTGIEWVPALFNSHAWGVAGLIWMILFLCNTYLIMTLSQAGLRRQTAKSPARTA